MNDRTRCMIYKRNDRVLPDGCDACGSSQVHCDCVRHMDDGRPCCRDCTHT